MKIYIISGKAGTGKTYIANKIKSFYSKAIILSYAAYLKEYARNIIGWNLDEKTKPRVLLQNLGDEVKSIDNLILIRRMIEDIQIYSKYFDCIIISDARFKEEIELIKDNYKVTTIHVIGKTSLSGKESEHITETALDNYHEYDYEINNDIHDIDKQILEIVRLEDE